MGGIYAIIGHQGLRERVAMELVPTTNGTQTFYSVCLPLVSIGSKQIATNAAKKRPPDA